MPQNEVAGREQSAAAQRKFRERLPKADADEAAPNGDPTAPRAGAAGAPKAPVPGDEAAPKSEVVAGADAWPNMDGVLLRLKPAAEEAPAKGEPGAGSIARAEGRWLTQPLLAGRDWVIAAGKGVAA